MTDKQHPQVSDDAPEIKPWYREPWPWVAIGIPAAAVIMGMTTLYLALANPDYLVVEEDEYSVIKSELRAQVPPAEGSQDAPQDQEDGER